MRESARTYSSEHIASIGMAVGALLSGGGLGGVLSLAAPVLAVVAAWRFVPRFWRKLGAAVLAGMLAGVVVLGPGLRLAMRAVAIADPNKTPEFTVGGTIFIIIMLGAIFGASFGVVVVFARIGFQIQRGTAGLIGAGVVLSTLMAIPDIRRELMDFGLGAGMNLPLFGFVGYAHAWATVAVFDRLKFHQEQPAPQVEAMA